MKLASRLRPGCKPWHRHTFVWSSLETSRALQAYNHKKERQIMSEKTTQTTREYLTTPGKGHMTLLTSYRRNGVGVGTPVGTVASHDKLYFMTPADTWKA